MSSGYIRRASGLIVPAGWTGGRRYPDSQFDDATVDSLAQGMAEAAGKGYEVYTFPASGPPRRFTGGAAEQVCRVCGCTEDRACLTPDGPCYWVAAGLCSACAGP